MASPAAPAAPAANTPPANFGSPPSGQIPILFNDHHVYSKPDELKQGRVLAALIRGGTILIPLRSMFEQMGATVAYDPASKTVDVTKPGADVKVTVGKPEVVINGETRPLDVPPEIYQGHVVVPVRVISEGMGAYVQWVPDRRVVVVRYLPPTPPPPPPPTTTPTPIPTTAPTPVPTPAESNLFVAGDWIIAPKVYNEFSPGNTGNIKKDGMSYRIRGAYKFDLFSLPWMIEGDFRSYRYPHNQTLPTDPNGVTGPFPGALCNGTNAVSHPNPANEPGCVTSIGGLTSTFVPAFTAQDQSIDARLGLQVANILDERIYIAGGYLWRTNNYGYPKINNFGGGLEVLPALKQTGWSLYGSAYYYPDVKGTCPISTCPTTGSPFVLSYNMFRYDVGAAVQLGPTIPAFFEFGFLGDSGKNHTNAPSDFSENGPYIGLGLKF
jgi:hypothetical protein